METGNINMEDLNIGIGTEEVSALKPATVEVVGVKPEDIQKDSKLIGTKVVFTVNHPEAKDTVQISSVKYEAKGSQLKVSGTWLNKDSSGLIRKGSALAVLLNKAGARNLSEMLNKKLETVADEAGYLAFKAY